MCPPGASSGTTTPSSQQGEEPPTPTVLCLLLGTDALWIPKVMSHGGQGDER